MAVDIQAERYVISVLALDQVGIVKSITSAIADLGGNIDGMSQTVVHGYFTLIITAAFAECRTEDEIRSTILENFGSNEISVVVLPYRASTPQEESNSGERYILTLTGQDRPAILKTVTSYLAENKINIEDYYFTIQGDHVTHIGEITIPSHRDIKELQGELQTLLSAFELVVTLQHENLFRATNDIFSIRQLIQVQKCEE